MAGPIRRTTRPNDTIKEPGVTARMLRQMYLGVKWSEITNITNPNNVTGLAATLVQGVDTITLTSGSTANLFIGQSLQANGANVGAFGYTSPSIIDIELGSTTNCTVDFAHASSGTISFDALSVVNTGLNRFIEEQMDIPIPTKTAEQPAMRQYRSDLEMQVVLGDSTGYSIGGGYWPYFIVSNDGTKTMPDKIMLIASGSNLTTFNPAFAVVNGTATLTSSANANTVFLSSANMTTNSVTIMCTQDGLSTNVTIIKVWPSSTSNVLSVTPFADEYYVQANSTANNLSSISTKLHAFLNNSDKTSWGPTSTWRAMTYSNVSSNVATSTSTLSGYGGGNITFSNMVANTANVIITANCGNSSSRSSVGSVTRTITLKKSFVATDSDPISTAKTLSISRKWYETKTMQETLYNLMWNAGPVGRTAGTQNYRNGTYQNVTQRFSLHPDKFRTRVGRALQEYFSLGYVDTIYMLYNTYPFDIFCKDAFANFKTLLMDVTRCYEMGYWLTFINNSKATGVTLPDENYAREIMQLFTIGLWELNLDGSRRKAYQLDTDDSRYIPNPTPGWDEDVPTYTYSADVANLARIFTGLRCPAGSPLPEADIYGKYTEKTQYITDREIGKPGIMEDPWNAYGNSYTYDGYRGQLIMDSRQHEYELPKVSMAWKYTGDANTVTGNTVEQDLEFAYTQANTGMIVIPRRSFVAANTLLYTEKANNLVAGSTTERDFPTSVAMREVDIALTALVNHPSCAPYFCGRMIRMMVTSNPSPAYIARVASVFRNDGTGTVGNLRAVFKAIILDQEARAPASKGLLARSTDLFDHAFTQSTAGPRYRDNRNLWFGATGTGSTSQYSFNAYMGSDQVGIGPLYQLSVFGTYPQLYSPVGPVSANNLVSPESYQYTDNNAIDVYNATAMSGRFEYWFNTGGYNEHLLLTSNTQIQSSAQANTNINAMISKYNILFTGNTLPQSFTSNLFSYVYNSNRLNYPTVGYINMLQAIHASPYSIIRT